MLREPNLFLPLAIRRLTKDPSELKVVGTTCILSASFCWKSCESEGLNVQNYRIGSEAQDMPRLVPTIFCGFVCNQSPLIPNPELFRKP